MNLFGRYTIAPNLGRRGRSSLVSIDPGPYRLRLPGSRVEETPPAPVVEEPATSQFDEGVREAETASPARPPSRADVDLFAQPPPDWTPGLAPSPLDSSSAQWSHQPDVADAQMPAEPEAVEFDVPPVPMAEATSDTLDAPAEDAVCGDDPQANTHESATEELPSYAMQEPAGLAAIPLPPTNGAATVGEDRGLEAPVRVIKLDPTREAGMVLRPWVPGSADTPPADAPEAQLSAQSVQGDDTDQAFTAALSAAAENAIVAPWPWHGDDNLAADAWRAELSIPAQADDSTCVRLLSSLSEALVDAPQCAAALRAGYASADSPALRLSLLAALGETGDPPEFWWCVASGATRPEERIVAYRALARTGDLRAYGYALGDPQACAAVALGHQLLRVHGEQAFNQALRSLEPDRAELLRAELLEA